MNLKTIDKTKLDIKRFLERHQLEVTPLVSQNANGKTTLVPKDRIKNNPDAWTTEYQDVLLNYDAYGIKTGNQRQRENTFLLVIDIDGDNHNASGFNRWNGFLSLSLMDKETKKQLEDNNYTFTVRSASGKGIHLYFYIPTTDIVSALNSSTKFNSGNGIDVIHGENNTITGPSSVKGNGKYEVICDKDIQVLPEELHQLVFADNSVKERDVVIDWEETTEQEELLTKLKTAAEQGVFDERNDWLAVGMALQNEGFTIGDWKSLSWTSGDPTDADLERYWNTFRDNNYSMGTLRFYAKTVEEENELIPFSLDHQGNADRILHLAGDRIKYIPELNEWYVFDGKIFSRQDKYGGPAFFQIRQEMLRYLEQEMNTFPENDEEKKSYSRWISSSKNRPTIDATIKDMKSRMDDNVFEMNNKNVLVFQNGTYDFDKMTFREHRQSDNSTIMLDIEYDENATAPHWDKFISEIFQDNTELIEYIQKFYGQSLSSALTPQVVLFLYGKGSNGKSTLNEVLTKILGGYVTHFNKRVLMEDKYKSSTAASPETAKLLYRRLGIASEIGLKDTLDQEFIKDLSGGDTISGRSLYKEPIEFENQASIILYGNEKPKVSGTDNGIWRRLKLIPFNRTFSEEEKDIGLKAKLIEEASGIMNWLIKGMEMFISDGLFEPEIIKQQTKDYREEEDELGVALQELLIPNTEDKSRFKTIVERVKQEIPDVNRKQLKNYMNEHGYTISKDSHLKQDVLYGYRVRTPIDNEFYSDSMIEMTLRN